MTEILDAPAHVTAVRITGRTGDADTEAVWAAIDGTPDGPRALYVEIGWAWGVGPGQFAADVREGLAMLAARARLERVAVVAGSYPRRRMIRDQAAAVAGVAVYVFPPAGRGAAMAWAADGVVPTVYVA